MRTTTLEVKGIAGVAGPTMNNLELKTFFWELKESTVKFYGQMTIDLIPQTPPGTYFTGQVYAKIRVPVHTIFQTEGQASGVLGSSFSVPTVGEITAHVGDDWIILSFTNLDPTLGTAQVSFSGCYEILPD